MAARILPQDTAPPKPTREVPQAQGAGILQVKCELGKEYGEVMRRLRRARSVHCWDGVLDRVSWTLFWRLT